MPSSRRRRERRRPVRVDGAVDGPDRGRPAAARRRLPVEPVRLDRRPPLDPDRARPRLDVPGTSPRTTGAFLGRDAIAREIADKTSRWKLTGLVLDWRDYDRHFDAAGLIPPKDHTPIQEEYYVYDDDLKQLGYATSLMYSPMLQRHIALARVPLELSAPGSRVKLELAVSHRYEYFDAHVTRLPLYNPDRRTA